MTLVLYAIVEHDALSGDLIGAADMTLRAVTDGHLTALVRDAPSPPVPDEPGLLAYERTMEKLMAATTILPARFGAVVDDDAELRSLLSERHDEFASALARVRGAVELGLRATVDVVVEHSSDAGSGTAYMRELLGRSRRARAVAAELERTFADIVRAGSYRVADQGAAVAASCLVDAEHVSEFVRRVGDLEQCNSGASFVCTGPWPPYSFTEAA